MEYFVYITNDCNLHCDYCSVLLDCQKNSIPIEPIYTIQQLGAFIANTQLQLCDNEVVVYFFGGEPSLRYDYIFQIMEQFGDCIQGSKVKYVLHTNGLLLKELPEYISRNLYLVMHSLNYEKIPHSQLHPSYFSSALSGLFAFRQQSTAPVIARLTITEETSLYTEVMQTAHFYDYVYWQIENCPAFKDYQKFYSTYTYETDLLFKVWFEYFKQGTMLNFVPFVAVLKFLLEPDRDDMKFSCGYGIGMIYIQTDGRCYACSDSVESGVHKIGDIYNGVVMPNPTLAELQCRNCPSRPVCMGRCGRMHKEFSPQHINEYCALNKHMFQLFIAHIDEIKSIYHTYPQYHDLLNSPILEFTEFTP